MLFDRESSMYRERRKTLPTVPSSITDAIQKVKIANKSIENKSTYHYYYTTTNYD